MSFDTGKVLNDMAAAITGVVESDADDIEHYARRILDDEKESLEELAEARLRGAIDDTVFDREIERERKVFEAGLLTLQIMSKATAQKAVNAALDVFVRAVKAAV